MNFLLGIIQRLWDPIATPVTLAAGVLATHLWKRYLNRLAVFRWSVRHQNVAVGGEGVQFGHVEVRWNNAAVEVLQFCVVELENESSKDFENVEVKLRYEDGTNFLSQGTVYGTQQFLAWTPVFAAKLARLTAADAADAVPDPDDVQQSLQRREYVIPVFNRGVTLTFAFLVNPPTIHSPVLQVTCDHRGARIYQSPERPMIYGVVQGHALAVGLLIGVLMASAVGATVDRTWVVATTAFVFGAFAQLIGAAAIRAKRWAVKAIG